MEPTSFIERLMHLPVLASEHGKDVDSFILYVHYLMAVLFVGWLGYFLYALWRFRAGNHPKADHVGVRGHFSSYLEVAVALVEAVLLIGFAIPLWAKAVEKFPADKDATVIRVTAEQFSWNARYPGKDGVFGKQDARLVASDNPLGYIKDDPQGKDDASPPLKDIRVPVGKPVIIHLTTKDVIHSFKVAPLRLTQDCIPGMSIPVHFVPNKPGKYLITCAQLCGNGHATMNGYFTVETPENFQKWLDGLPKAGAATSFE